MSLRRQNPWMLSNISAKLLFWGGVLALPAYLLQGSLLIRIAQVVFFGYLATVAGKRLQWVYFISIMVTITIFHLIVPSGAVIAEIGGFRLTLGAMRTGVFKAFTIVGMVFISLVSVRSDLRLPGTVGAVAGKVFWSFEQIMERREEVHIRDPLASADLLLSGIYDQLATMDDSAADTAQRKETAVRSRPVGIAIVVAIVAVQWIALVPTFW